jgi:nucleoside-diphosphate-sugar epimerase
MSILLFGSKSFIGRNIIEYFEKEYNVEIVGICREQVDCLNSQQVFEITKQYSPELVINCVVKGGRLYQLDTAEVLYENILTHQNIVQSASKAGVRIITFGSGAEVAREKQTFELEEKVYLEPELVPKDYYGLSKYTTHLMEQSVNSLVNIRVFGCFGPDDNEQKFLNKIILSMKDDKPVIINNNKYMDFIYIKDLCSLVFNVYKKRGFYPKTVNAVYKRKYSLLDIVNLIKERTWSQSTITVLKEETISYIGKYEAIKKDGNIETGLMESWSKMGTI